MESKFNFEDCIVKACQIYEPYTLDNLPSCEAKYSTGIKCMSIICGACRLEKSLLLCRICHQHRNNHVTATNFSGSLSGDVTGTQSSVV